MNPDATHLTTGPAKGPSQAQLNVMQGQQSHPTTDMQVQTMDFDHVQQGPAQPAAGGSWVLHFS